MAGAGEGHHIGMPRLLGDDLTHPQQGSFLNALGDGDQHGTGIEMWGDRPAYGADGEGGACDDHNVAASDAGGVGGDFQRLRQTGALQPGIDAAAANLGSLFLGAEPERGVVAVPAEQQRQGSAPCAGTDNSGFHAFFPFLKKSVLASVPLSSRLMFSRC